MSDQVPPVQPSPDPKPKPNNRRTILIILALGLFFTCAACGLISLFLPDSNSEAEIAEAEIAEQLAPTDELLENTAQPAKSTDEPTLPPSPTATPEPEQPEPTVEPTLPPTEPASTSTPLPQPTTSPQPTETLPALPTLEELRELTAAELALRNTLDKALGESNRGLGRRLNLFTLAPPDLMPNSVIIGWSADTAETNALIREAMQRDTLTVLRAVVDSGLDYEAVLLGSKYLMPIEQLEMNDELEVLTLNYSRDTLATTDWDAIIAEDVFGIADFFIIHPDFEP